MRVMRVSCLKVAHNACVPRRLPSWTIFRLFRVGTSFCHPLTQRSNCLCLVRTTLRKRVAAKVGFRTISWSWLVKCTGRVPNRPSLPSIAQSADLRPGCHKRGSSEASYCLLSKAALISVVMS